ncbi:MAG: FAD-dependent 5-carboxymethylaminomethyl-2-thiouridine(34) oxidoreductase MnmC [Xylophilus sp.]|nr:FAD-dependent 5-carboxymethylaminomethyl-2-thiouridine(34) oxidoreductase MnmC [Xylophilus sp.]MBP8229194.1 FAD-dependent 5-carboxymethylaminomethyl-2-thiouridine(34) oxidoreductase MnmC [Xylophilus sp.]
MSEPINWLPDGTPFSPRFNDRYRSETGGMTQARDVFLHGCGLPAAWAGAPQWRILETGFGLGLNFLVTWAAWKADPARPRLLHFVSVEAFPASADDLLQAVQAHPELLPLAEQLHAQFHALTPGFHRLVFENGQVLLTLCVGDAKAMLREQFFAADSVYLDGFSPQRNPDIWDEHTLKAVARCCRRGTRVATWTIARSVRDGLSQCGFTVQKVPGVPPKRDNLQAEFNPRWEPRRAPGMAALPVDVRPGTCLVVGAGLAGASVAASLARRGWQVQVLDAGATPAAGASGLPAGVLAPHVSPDDSLLSRLSRAGVRATLQQAHTHLAQGVDWQPSGVLEHRVDGSPGIGAAANASSQPASATTLAAAGLPPDAVGCWHSPAGWIKPAQLVQALLAQPGIHFVPHTPVAQLVPEPDGWQAQDSHGQLLARADMVVVAAACASGKVFGSALGHPLPLHPIRGQMSWGLRAADGSDAACFPPFPVNGDGTLVPAVPTANGLAWYAGATFERSCADPVPDAATQARNHQANFTRLQTLLPGTAQHLAGVFADPAALHSWSQVRCASHDRLPLVGPVAHVYPGLWLSTAMGSRGISLAVLCGELLAARLHGEPLPLELRLAQALGVERLA